MHAATFLMPQLMLMSMKNSVKVSSFYIIFIDVDVREASFAIAAQSARCGTASPIIHVADYCVKMIRPVGSSSSVSVASLPSSSSSASPSVPRASSSVETIPPLGSSSSVSVASRSFFFCVCGISHYILREILG